MDEKIAPATEVQTETKSEFQKSLDHLADLGVQLKKSRLEMLMLSEQINKKTAEFMQVYYDMKGEEISLGEIIKTVLSKKHD